MLNDETRFMTVQEIANRLLVNQQTVRNWISRGELRGIRVGPRRVRVTEDDFSDFLENAATRRPGPIPKLSPEARRLTDEMKRTTAALRSGEVERLRQALNALISSAKELTAAIDLGAN